MAALHRPTTFLPRAFGWPRLSRGLFLLVGTVAVLVMVAGLQVYQLSRATSKGYVIDDLRRLRAARQAENHALEAEVAQLSSLARVDWEARTRLHLEPARRRLYIEVNQALPEFSLPAQFQPAADDPAAVPTADEPLWRDLLGALPFN